MVGCELGDPRLKRVFGSIILLLALAFAESLTTRPAEGAPPNLPGSVPAVAAASATTGRATLDSS
jgi:hypothetical protein